MCCLNVWPSASLQLYIVAHCDKQLHAPDLNQSTLILITNVSKIFKSCFLFHYQKYDVYILCLTFFSKTLKIRIYELKFFKLQKY